MLNEEKIKNSISDVLNAYKQQIGCGFFTRRSRKVMVRELENALKSGSIADVINQVLTFSWSMQGENPDVGFFGQSKLHSILWGNCGPRINVYQLIFNELKNLNENHPQHELLSQIIFPTHFSDNKNNEEKTTSLQKLPKCFRTTDENSKMLLPHSDLRKRLLDQESTFLQKLMRCIGYNWTKNCSLSIR